MYEHEYEAMYQLGNSHSWYVARRELGGQNSVRILDVGCGTGTNVSAFGHLAPTVGVDASMDALHFCQTRGINELSLSPVEKLPFSFGAFDIVTALDVLEHTDDDLLYSARNSSGHKASRIGVDYSTRIWVSMERAQ